MIGLIMLGSVINYLTRSSLAVAAPTLLHDLHITEKQYSWIVGAFQGAIMAQPVCGYIMDVLGLKIGFAIFAIAWSLVNMAHALAGSWQGFAFLRGLLGFSEGSANPAGMKATAEWFPASERGIAGGVFNTGASVGSMLAPPLVAWAILTYNWRFAFVITGSLGLVWVVLWLLFYQPPSKHAALSAEERDYIAAGQEKHLQGDGTRPSILKILRQRNFWGIAIPRFLADPTWGTLSFWMPLYLSSVRHMDLKHIALFAWMPFLAADLGCFFGGLIAMTLQKRAGLSVINARRCAFTVGRYDDVGRGIRRRGGESVRRHCPAGSRRLRPSDALRHRDHHGLRSFRKNEVATAAGMAGTLGNAGLLIFSLLIGGLVATIGYTPFFICLGVFDLIGAAVLWSLVRERA